jgi:hypothetical protein
MNINKIIDFHLELDQQKILLELMKTQTINNL